jgi:hypothetical protein
LRVIEYVEYLSAKLQLESFSQRRVFCDREIGVPKTWAVNRIAAEVTEISSRLRKRQGIQVAIRGTASEYLVNPRHHVGALMKIDSPV